MADVFDLAHFQMMTGGDAALQTEVIGLFRTQAAKSLAELEAAPQAQVWRDAAHTLKGSARGLGLWVLAEACEQAEAHPGEPSALGGLRAALTGALDALGATARA